MTNYISLETQEDINKRKNFFYMTAIFWFVWIIFHFTAVFFFWMVLQSVLLVWLFLWLGNLIALLVDTPIWVLQKYFKPKSLIISWQVFLILTAIIFAKFIYFTSSIEIDPQEWITSILTHFLWSWINVVLILLAALFYWIIKEIFDVTSFSYIMNNSDPSEYAKIISRNNTYFGVWALIWLISSWVILALNMKIAILLFIILIILFIIFTVIFFENPNKTITFSDIKDLKLTLEKTRNPESFQKIKDYAVEKIQKADLMNIAKNSKYIFLKPMELKASINFKEMFGTIIQEFKNTASTIFSQPISIALVWCIWAIWFFWFWDTFVATFQIEFLNKILSDAISQNDVVLSYTKQIITWYILLWLLIIPVFATQQFFIELSKKVWVSKIMSLWILASWISIAMFWIANNFWIILLFWLINSLWYAAVMPLAQSSFSEIYNKEYSKKFNLNEIDSNAAAAPLKILWNFANVIWLIIGWLLVQFLWFNWFFIFFGFWLIMLLAFTILIIQKHLDF